MEGMIFLVAWIGCAALHTLCELKLNKVRRVRQSQQSVPWYERSRN
jgi:hypothetical protein